MKIWCFYPSVCSFKYPISLMSCCEGVVEIIHCISHTQNRGVSNLLLVKVGFVIPSFRKLYCSEMSLCNFSLWVLSHGFGFVSILFDKRQLIQLSIPYPYVTLMAGKRHFGLDDPSHPHRNSAIYLITTTANKLFCWCRCYF